MRINRQLLGICLLIVSCVFLVAGCGTKAKQESIVHRRMGNGATLKAKQEEEKQLEKEAEEKRQDGTTAGLYILKQLDIDKKQVILLKASDNRQVQYDYDTLTMFTDKYGNSKSQTSFIEGEVVEIELSKDEKSLTSLQVSDRVWVQEEIFNYSIEEKSRVLTIGKTKYSYDADLPIFSGDLLIDFDMLEECDVIRAVGIDKDLISVSVTSGHGYLALSNTDIFNDSFICIGDKIFEKIEPDITIMVPEGTHLVTVANDGYGGSREVTVERNMTASLNLDELKGEGPKMCKITFKVGVEGAILLIDDEKVDYSEPVEVRYGIHTVAVGAEGYDTVTQKLVVNSETAEIEIGLTETEEESSDQQNNASNNNANNTNNNNSNNNSNNNNTNNNNNNNNNSNTNNTNNNNNNNSNNNSNNNASTDYLTTLYNLLTSVDSDNSSNSTANLISSYDDLKDQ